MTWQLYVGLSAMMFFEFAIWGAWSPVLAARLLGPLKMTGKQLGWIYGMMPLACIVAPLAAGQVVDRWVPTQWYLGVTHLVGGVLLLVAARTTRFLPLLLVMGLYSLSFAPTLALVNSLTFTHMPDPEQNYFRVRMWGAISWVLAGWALTAWRRSGKFQVRGADSLTLAGVFALVMGVYCFFLPHTPPAHKAGAVIPFIQAIYLLGDPNFALFLALSFVVSTQLQFYFLGTARFLGDIGTSDTVIPAAMSIAQAAQVVAMAAILPYTFKWMGYQWTLAAGAALWLVMFLVYRRMQPRSLIIASMALHGLAYAFFFDAAFLYVKRVTPAEIPGSAQGLYTVVTMGLGLFVGTRLTGIVMDRMRDENGFRWRAIFLVPCVTLAICAVAFAVFFKG